MQTQPATRRRTNAKCYNGPASKLFLALALGSACAFSARGPDLEARVRGIGAPGAARLDDRKRAEIRAEFRGLEKEAVSYCVAVDIRPGMGLSRGVDWVLGTFEDLALTEFKRAFKSVSEVGWQQKTRLRNWMGVTTLPEGFRFAVDSLLPCRESAERSSALMRGVPRRLCDTVYSKAMERIAEHDRYDGRPCLLTTTPVAERDSTIKEFQVWWEANKGDLAWSPETDKFVLDHDGR